MSRYRMFRVVATLMSAAAFLAAGSSVASAAVRARPASGVITVAASEYKFKLSTTSLKKPGSVTFKVTNVGKVAHDFQVDKKTTKLLQAGQSVSLTVAFAKKGSYYYDCTVPGHAALGMKGYFKVL
jgi:uncharacterized cupredoxin-like copper-binding protein